MKQKIKVVYIMHSSSKYEGSNKSLLNMLEGLILKEVQPLVFMPAGDDMSMCNEFKLRNIFFVILPYFLPISPLLNSLKDYVLYVPRLLRIIYLNYIATKKIIAYSRQQEADLIHSNVGPILMGYNAAKAVDIPHIWHIREYQDLDFNMKTFFSKKGFLKKLHEPLNHPIAITDGIYNHFSLNSNARVIYNGILKTSDARFIAEKEKYFLFVGYLRESKGIRSLILAFADFVKTHSDYKLCIAGDTSDKTYKETLFSIVNEKGVNDKVIFWGLRDDISNLMTRATALIVPSVYEAFGRITAEAMFNGCFVIGNNSGGTKEIIEKAGCGILYSGHGELIEAMETVVCKGIESYYSMIRKTMEQAAVLFSKEQNIEAVHNYYTEILGKN